MLRRHPSLLRLALPALLAAPLLAQTALPPDSEAPSATLKINVRTVLVDVVVLDKNNQPVPHLNKDDFQVLEDGKPQSIAFFEPNFDGVPGVAVSAPAPPLPPNTFTNVPTVAPSNTVNLLLMDGLNTPLADQAYVHRRMVSYLATIPPGLRIGVFLLSEKLRIIQGFTQDSALLRASINRLAANPSTSALLPTSYSTAAMNMPVNMILDKAIGADATTLADMAAGLQQFEDQQGFFEVNERTIMTLDALQQIARYLAGVPGRKNVIWFVGSIPNCLAAMTSENELTVAGCPYEEKFAKTMDMLADSRVSLYPIDAVGLQSDSLFDAASATTSSSIGASGTGATAANLAVSPALSPYQALNAAQVNSLENDNQERTLDHRQMDELARVTGGKAVYERNSIKEALAADVDNGSRYYTLAYTPTNRKEVGKQRKIEIRSLNGNYKLAYRRSYFEDSPNDVKLADKAPAGDPLRPLMDRGMPNFTQLRYRMSVAPANPQPVATSARAGDNPALRLPVTRFTVNFALTTDGLTLVPDPDGVRRGKIEVAVVAYSQDGKLLNWEVRTINLAIKPAQLDYAQTSGIPFHFDIDAPPGDVYLRTGIYDSVSSKAGTLEIPLSVVTVAQR
jgi:VWFA-related protein